MGNTLNLRAAIQSKLLTYCTDTTYQKAKKTHSSTWAVFNVDDFTYEETLNQVRLEIDLMHQSADTSTLEDLADQIWEALDHWDYIDSIIAFSCYQNAKNVIAEDGGLQHRRLTFSIRLYK